MVTVHSQEVEQLNNKQEIASKVNDVLIDEQELDSRHRMLDEIFPAGRRGRRPGRS